MYIVLLYPRNKYFNFISQISQTIVEIYIFLYVRINLRQIFHIYSDFHTSRTVKSGAVAVPVRCLVFHDITGYKTVRCLLTLNGPSILSGTKGEKGGKL